MITTLVCSLAAIAAFFLGKFIERGKPQPTPLDTHRVNFLASGRIALMPSDKGDTFAVLTPTDPGKPLAVITASPDVRRALDDAMLKTAIEMAIEKHNYREPT